MEIVGPRGHRLDVEVDPSEGGQALIYHTGTPMAGTLFARSLEEGRSRGLRHIAYSRPGYGRSERCVGRTVADCVQDVEAIADQLGVEQFFTVGWSGGGPHALACAALMPERVLAAATIASVAPRHADGLDWLDGMGEENLAEFRAAEAGGEQLVAYLEHECAQLSHATGPELHAALGDLLSEVDKSALTGGFADYLAANIREALANGLWGWFDDDLAHLNDWGFDLDSISRPVTIWQGQQDRFVPFAHGQWLAAHVPGARPQLRAADGHLSLVIGAYGELLDDLAAAARLS
jgi:pimeloyl-ACP methyl ester carboxylesterase